MKHKKNSNGKTGDVKKISDGKKPKQVYLTAQAKHDLKVELAKRDMMQNDFTILMLNHYQRYQDEIEGAPGWVHPESYKGSASDCKAFTMRFDDYMQGVLEGCLAKAKRIEPEMSERRLLRSMFDVYLAHLKEQSSK